jgi:hypothetical protein
MDYLGEVKVLIIELVLFIIVDQIGHVAMLKLSNLQRHQLFFNWLLTALFYLSHLFELLACIIYYHSRFLFEHFLVLMLLLNLELDSFQLFFEFFEVIFDHVSLNFSLVIDFGCLLYHIVLLFQRHLLIQARCLSARVHFVNILKPELLVYKHYIINENFKLTINLGVDFNFVIAQNLN